MKTAEEVLNANETDPGPLHWITKKAAVIAMKEYAKQWVDKCYKDVLLEIQLEQLKRDIDAQ